VRDQRRGLPNTGDKLRSSIACAGFVCFIPLFGGSRAPGMKHVPIPCAYAWANSRLQMQSGAANSVPKNRKIRTSGFVGAHR
jgi:hypothetical protein